MTKSINLTGQIFSRLTVIRRAPNTGKHTKWVCRCECGNTSTPTTTNLMCGTSKSCGCLKRNKRHFKHGLTGSVEYKVWLGMRKRCYQKTSNSYPYYGAIGVTMSDEWLDSPQAFLSDMGERPSANHTIERVNNNKGYSADNCKWATKTEQALNRRSNHIITYNGVTKTICEWADLLGIKRTTLMMRIGNYGWSTHKAFTQPVRKRAH